MDAFRIDPELTPKIVELIFAGDIAAIDAAFAEHPEWVGMAQVYYARAEETDNQISPLRLTLLELLRYGNAPDLIRHLLGVHGFTPHIGIEVAIAALKGEMMTTHVPPQLWHQYDVRGNFHNMGYFGKHGRTVWIVHYAERELEKCMDFLKDFRENPDEDTPTWIPDLKVKEAYLTEILPTLREFALRMPVPMIAYPYHC